MTKFDRFLVVAAGLFVLAVEASATRPDTPNTDEPTLVVATATMEERSEDRTRRGCKESFRVELLSEGKSGMAIVVKPTQQAGCSTSQGPGEPVRFLVHRVQTVGASEKHYQALDHRQHTTAKLIDNRNRARAEDREPAWTLQIEESPAPGVKPQVETRVHSTGTVDHRNDATSGERVVFVDLWFHDQLDREQIKIALFPLHVMTEKTLPLPDKTRGFRVAIASELPIQHVISQIRPIEEIDLIGHATEARFE